MPIIGPMLHINFFYYAIFIDIVQFMKRLIFFIIMNTRMKTEVSLNAFALMYIYSSMNYH